MAISISPLPESTIPNAPKRNLDPQFGRVVEGIDLANLTDSELSSIQELLYTHSVLVFPNTKLSSEKQYQLTKSFDPTSESYGHGKGRSARSILHPDLKTIPDVPQVQLIGNGLVKEHEGLVDARLKHPHHKTFHKTVVSEQDEKAGKTRFYRWHIDAALYELSPPRVTSLYALQVPTGQPQICVYDDGTGDELAVPLGTTAFVSGKDMFESLSDEDKSLAVRCTAVYSPHPYVWMSKARSNSCGLGLESEGLELEEKDLPEYEESKIKELPMLWKNPVTGALHFQVHPSAVSALKIAPLPSGSSKTTSAPYPNGAMLTDLKEVRALVYRLQRPAIAPSKVYAHDWKEGDMALFHNQGVLHSVVGAFEPEEVRMFHQCNLAASCDPKGPDAADLERYA